jgi:hypothetical protein
MSVGMVRCSEISSNVSPVESLADLPVRPQTGGPHVGPSETEAVGYKHPPNKTQFKPGQSGNPDQTVYFVVDRFGKFSSVHRETEIERTDLETIITDLMSGQFNDPIRVVAFNTLEHWSEDVSNGIALEIQTRCDIEGLAVPEHIQDFVGNFTGPTRQLALGWYNS